MNLRQHAALTDRLIAAVGGVKIAESVSRLGKSSFYKASDAADRYCLPADVVLVLEDYAGVSLYTAALFEASQAAAPTGRHLDIVSEALLLGEQVAHFTRDLHAANSDGRLTPRELDELTLSMASVHTQLAVINRELDDTPPPKGDA